jgi:hypothetical protein
VSRAGVGRGEERVKRWEENGGQDKMDVQSKPKTPADVKESVSGRWYRKNGSKGCIETLDLESNHEVGEMRRRSRRTGTEDQRGEVEGTFDVVLLC